MVEVHEDIKAGMIEIWKRKARFMIVKFVNNYGGTELEHKGERAATFDDMKSLIEACKDEGR